MQKKILVVMQRKPGQESQREEIEGKYLHNFKANSEGLFSPSGVGQWVGPFLHSEYLTDRLIEG
jgi:hypothetical protein